MKTYCHKSQFSWKSVHKQQKLNSMKEKNINLYIIANLYLQSQGDPIVGQ